MPHCAPKAQVDFELRAFALDFFGFADAGAADRAGPAGLVLDQVFFGQLFTGDGFSTFELGLLMVAGGQCPDVVHDVHQHHGAELRQRLAGKRAGGQQFAGFVKQEFEAIFIFDFGAIFAFDHDGFEIFAAHHGPRAATGHSPLPVVHDGSDATLFLSCRADAEHVTFVVVLAEFLGQRKDAHAPQFAGIVEGDDIVLDLDPNRLFGLAPHDQDVVASLFELHAPETAGVCIQHGAGQRAFGGDRKAIAGLVAGGGQRAIGKDEHIFGAERVNFRPDHIPQQTRTHSTPTDKQACHFHIQRVGFVRLGRQVDIQYFFIPTGHVFSFVIALTLTLSRRERRLPSPFGGRAGDEGKLSASYWRENCNQVLLRHQCI